MKLLLGLFLSTSLTAGFAPAQEEALAERVSAIKTSLAESQKALHTYEWIETTVVSLKGEEKSHQQNRCYYGADKKLQKVPVGAEPQQEEKHRGLRGRIVEHKKEELTEEMKAAVELLHKYVPPDPQKIQAAKEAGKVSFQPTQEKRAFLTFTDYIKAKDSLKIEVDLATNRLLSMKVATYLDSPDKPVTLDVRYDALQDGTSYTSDIVLEDKGASMKVGIQNTGYRKMEQG